MMRPDYDFPEMGFDPRIFLGKKPDPKPEPAEEKAVIKKPTTEYRVVSEPTLGRGKNIYELWNITTDQLLGTYTTDELYKLIGARPRTIYDYSRNDKVLYKIYKLKLVAKTKEILSDEERRKRKAASVKRLYWEKKEQEKRKREGLC